MLPRISALVPCYNHADTLPQALDTLCQQDYRPAQILVIDDGSTDACQDVIRAYCLKYPFLTAIRHAAKSGNADAACAPHFQSVTGDYLLICGADDYLYPGFLSRAAEMIERHPGVGVCFGDVDEVNDEGKVVYRRQSGVSAPCFLNGSSLESLLVSVPGFPSGSGSIIRRDAYLDAVQKLRPYRIGLFSDVLLHSAVAFRYGAYFVPMPFSAFRLSSQGFSKAFADRPTEYLGCVREGIRFMRARDVSPSVPATFIRAWRAAMMGFVADRTRWRLQEAHNGLRKMIESLDDRGSLTAHCLNLGVRKLYSALYRFLVFYTARTLSERNAG